MDCVNSKQQQQQQRRRQKQQQQQQERIHYIRWLRNYYSPTQRQNYKPIIMRALSTSVSMRPREWWLRQSSKLLLLNWTLSRCNTNRRRVHSRFGRMTKSLTPLYKLLLLCLTFSVLPLLYWSIENCHNHGFSSTSILSPIPSVRNVSDTCATIKFQTDRRYSSLYIEPFKWKQTGSENHLNPGMWINTLL